MSAFSQRGRQALGSGQIGTVILIEQEDPASLQPKQRRHMPQRRVQGPRQIDLLIERLGDGVQNRQFAVALLKPVGIGFVFMPVRH